VSSKRGAFLSKKRTVTFHTVSQATFVVSPVKERNNHFLITVLHVQGKK